MRTVFQIRGATGAGKTTLMRGLLHSYETPKTIAVPTSAHGRQKCTTAGPLFAVGDYNHSAKCVGCDRLKGRAPIFDITDALIDRGVQLIGLESMIFSTTFKMSSDLSKNALARGYDFKLVFLDVDFETAADRIHERNGGKPFSLDGLARRLTAYETSRDKCIRAGIPSVRVDARANRREVLDVVREAVDSWAV